MHDSGPPLPGIHTINYEPIYVGYVLCLGIRQGGKPTGEAYEDFDVAIDNKLADREVIERRIGNVRARTFESNPTDDAIAEKIGELLQLSLVDDRLQVEAEGLFPDIDIMEDTIEGRAAFIGICRHARIVHHDDRRALIGGNVGGAGGFNEVGEDEIDIRRGQNMPGIIARPDSPTIRELSVESSEVVKKLAHKGSEFASSVRFSN